MRTRTFIAKKGIIIIIEDDHNRVSASLKGVNRRFASFKVALIWAMKEVFDGNIRGY